MVGARKRSVDRPDIFSYHDYRTFLRDWFSYLKSTVPGFSQCDLSIQAQQPSNFLAIILSGRRELSMNNLAKLAPLLKLNRSERSYFEQLVKLKTLRSFDGQLEALEQMRRFSGYQKRNPQEAEFFEYTRHWYYFAIREMAALEGFRLEPEWIRDHLEHKVSLPEIRAAIEFLTEHGYIELDEKGGVRQPKEDLICKGEVLTAALSQFHKQIFSLASNSIEVSPPNERNIVGYTFAINSGKYDAARKIIDQAIAQIEALEKSESSGVRDVVYQVEVALFPIAKASGT